MAEKTVMQVIDEYRNRQNAVEFSEITFEYPEDHCLELHRNVSNLYSDGKKVVGLKRDEDYHEYQLDRRFDSWGDNKPAKFVRYTFVGKITRFSQNIED